MRRPRLAVPAAVVSHGYRVTRWLRSAALGKFLAVLGIAFVVVVFVGGAWATWTDIHLLDRPSAPATVVAFAAIVAFALWKLPQWQVARSRGRFSAAKRIELENTARSSLAQIIGGAVLLFGVYQTWQTINVNQQGQITDRYTHAIEQLGATDGEGRPRLEVRLGGIYALERIARDSAEDQGPIMEILTAYVRSNAPRGAEMATPTTAFPDATPPSLTYRSLRADVEAALVVIGRRDTSHDPSFAENAKAGCRLDLAVTDRRGARMEHAALADACLNTTDLRDADLFEADLTNAWLARADLRGANLSGAILRGAYLSKVNLSDLNLSHTELHGALFPDAYMRGADLSGGNDLTNTVFVQADLTCASFAADDLAGVSFYGANLSGVNFYGANLSGADFSGAILSGADLRHADLRGSRGLTDLQLASAILGSETKLPSSFPSTPDTTGTPAPPDNSCS
jgi:uncharacterized protein YjbI with pentapeptide repeats